MDGVEEALQARTWQTKLNLTGCLIASDNPVIIDWPQPVDGRLHQLANRGISGKQIPGVME
jgi:hypothetical protein